MKIGIAGTGAWARQQRKLATRSEVVITILTDAAAIDATYGGANGLLAGEVRGKLFIEMSTVRPETEIALLAKVKAKGAAMVDCPVGGSVGPGEGRQALRIRRRRGGRRRSRAGRSSTSSAGASSTWAPWARVRA